MEEPNRIVVAIVLILSFCVVNITHEDIQLPPETNVLEAPSIPILIKNKTLFAMANEDIELYNLAYKIIECESGWDYTAQNPNSTAYGAGQFLNGTWSYIQKKWGIKLDRYNKEDQLYATIRLLKEESWKHWSESKHCWDK
jgi:hypothetical protein